MDKQAITMIETVQHPLLGELRGGETYTLDSDIAWDLVEAGRATEVSDGRQVVLKHDDYRYYVIVENDLEKVRVWYGYTAYPSVNTNPKVTTFNGVLRNKTIKGYKQTRTYGEEPWYINLLPHIDTFINESEIKTKKGTNMSIYTDNYGELNVTRDADFIEEGQDQGFLDTIPKDVENITVCTLEVDTNTEHDVALARCRVVGFSYQSKYDRFFPLKGRYVALTRALDQLKSMGVKPSAYQNLVVRKKAWADQIKVILEKAKAKDKK